MTERDRAEQDMACMGRALELARQALELDEVPVGAVVTVRGAVVGEGYNLRESAGNALAHAELRALETACRTVHGWRLPDSVLYVTLEPCLMCGGALLGARVERVVYGAPDARGGAFGGLTDFAALPGTFRPTVTGGVREEECRALLAEYFRRKRETGTDRRSAGKNFIV